MNLYTEIAEFYLFAVNVLEGQCSQELLLNECFSLLCQCSAKKCLFPRSEWMKAHFLFISNLYTAIFHIFFLICSPIWGCSHQLSAAPCCRSLIWVLRWNLFLFIWWLGCCRLSLHLMLNSNEQLINVDQDFIIAPVLYGYFPSRLVMTME